MITVFFSLLSSEGIVDESDSLFCEVQSSHKNRNVARHVWVLSTVSVLQTSEFASDQDEK